LLKITEDTIKNAKRELEIERSLEQLNKWYRNQDKLKAERARGFLVGFMLGGTSGVFCTLAVVFLAQNWNQ
jgi:hypothetical protein